MEIKETQDLGSLLRQTRKSQAMTQADLALTSGTGVRFISDLENGKATCEIGKILKVMQMLGLKLKAVPKGEK